MAKGIKIEEWVKIKEKGTCCVKNMAWETPYIIFERHNGQQMIWHSDNANEAFEWLRINQNVQLFAFLYDDHLRRVTVLATFGDMDSEEGMTVKTFGMKRK